IQQHPTVTSVMTVTCFSCTMVPEEEEYVVDSCHHLGITKGGHPSPCHPKTNGSVVVITSSPAIPVVTSAAVNGVLSHSPVTSLSSSSSPPHTTISGGLRGSGVSQGLVDSRSISSYQQLKLSFLSDDSPTHSQPPTI